MTPPTVTAIIVSWNVREALRQCLENVRRSIGVVVRTVVVDNASADGSADMVERAFPEVRLIKNQGNRGFAAAVNQGIERSRGDVLLLNPDALLQPDTLEKLEHGLARNPHAGIVGPQLRYPDKALQPSVRRFPRAVDLVLTLLKLPNFFPGLLKRYAATDLDYDRQQVVDQVMGSCFLIRRRTLEDVGTFDERFYLWFEEVDFCKRAKAKGWMTMLIPDAQAAHERGASFKQLPPVQKQGILMRSMYHYAKKHFNFFSAELVYAVGVVSMLLAACQQLFRINKPFRAKDL